MKRPLIILIIVSLGFCLYLICRPAKLPTADLNSPSQEIRDAAAKVLRAKAKPTWKIKWLFFTRHLKKGETETNVLDLLQSYHLKPEPGKIFGGLGEYAVYGLDNYWSLGCEYNNNDYKRLTLDGWKLRAGWRSFYVAPPTNFSGVWVNYYASGQKANEEHYKDGQRSGELVCFESDGSIRATQYYDDGKRHGLWTQYFPSLHKIEMQRQYSNNLQIADEIWYYTNGSIRTITHYEGNHYNGPRKIFSPTGKIASQCLYSNFTKVGLEIKYNEDGTTNSVEDHSHP
jgi:antitoxin component YwqK of YwqJK toxin-antitoxin module